MGYKSWQTRTSRQSGDKKHSLPALKFRRHTFNLRVSIDGGFPKVLISPQAFKDMFCLVDIVDGEVGWVGTVEQLDKDFLIKEVFLPKQEANHGTCELTPEGIAQLGMELIESREDGVEVASAIRFWGHSHHRIATGTQPSSMDDKQLRELAESCGDYFIRGIFTKDGRMEFTIYLYSKGVTIHDVEWDVHDPVERELREEWETAVKSKVSLKKAEPPIVRKTSPPRVVVSSGDEKSPTPTDVSGFDQLLLDHPDIEEFIGEGDMEVWQGGLVRESEDES